MDPDLSQGMNTMYPSGQGRQPYHGYHPSHQSPYGEASQHGAHTLPPIQSQRPAFSHQTPAYDSMARQPQHQGHALNYQSYGSPNVSQSPYTQGMSQYSQAPYSQGPSQIAHDYHGSQGHLPNIRPMPPGAPVGGQGYNMQNVADQDFQARTHVVGSQGRRGILPSDEGRPAAPISTGTGTTAKAAAVPAKDAEGKYPCPHCTKTYLHAKHLKRHLLRHTGDRPYSCALCQDTFSRSDILKRHFQKCSIRRGNPTGATHLSNSQSHLKKQQAKKAATTTTETGFPTAPHTPTSIAYGEGGTGLGMSHIPTGSNAQGLSSRSDHDRQHDEGRRTVNGSSIYNRSSAGLPGSSGYQSLPSSGSSTPLTSRIPGQFPPSYTPESAHTRVNSFSQSYSQNLAQNRHSMPQVQSGSAIENNFDWDALQGHRSNPQLPSPTHQEHTMRPDSDQKMPYPSTMENHGELMNYFGREGIQHQNGLNWSMIDTYHRKLID